MIGVIIVIVVIFVPFISLLMLFFCYKKKLDKFNPNKNSNSIEGVIENVQVYDDGLVCVIRRLDNNEVIRTDKLSKELVAKLDMESLKFVTYHYEFDSIINKHMYFILNKDGSIEHNLILLEQVNRLKIACICAITVIIGIVVVIFMKTKN